jgi:flagellar basal-body rod protein FlgC
LKIGGNFPGFNISAKGLSIQRKKMDMIAENIANADTIRTESGQPYKRKFITIKQKPEIGFQLPADMNRGVLKLATTNQDHISNPASLVNETDNDNTNLVSAEQVDQSQGEVVYMPDSPYADEKGYVEMSNVDIITEMVDMIAASRSYEANLTALNSSKQMEKDSLEI